MVANIDQLFAVVCACGWTEMNDGETFDPDYVSVERHPVRCGVCGHTVYLIQEEAI